MTSAIRYKFKSLATAFVCFASLLTGGARAAGARGISAALAVAACAAALACAPAALAASTVTYGGQDAGFEFADGTEWHATDLFPQLKGVMPGDELVQAVTFENASAETDFVSLYLRVEAHDEGGNPPDSAQVAEGETAASMVDFLSQLELEVALADGTVLYSGAAHMAGLEQGVPLGDVRSGESLALVATLRAPIELGDEYAGRLGEVDWVFVIEAKDDPVSLCVTKVWDDGGAEDRPSHVVVELRDGGVPVERAVLSAGNAWTHRWDGLDFEGDWSVAEVEVPAGYSPHYSVRGEWVTVTNSAKLVQTGQLRWPVPALACGGAAVCALGAWLVLGARGRGREGRADA